MTSFVFNGARRGCFSAAVFLAQTFATFAANQVAVERPALSVATPSLAKLPMYFEANTGQADPEAQFISRGRGYALFLTKSEAVLSLRDQGARSRTIRLRLVDATPNAIVEGIDPLSGTVNYFVGNEPGQWRSGVPTFEKVKYSQVYSGVDLLYYGNQQRLEYDFIVHPGADPRTIGLAFEGSDGVEVDASGDLCVRMGDKEVRWLKPVAYQEVSGIRKEVPCAYAVTGQQVKFTVSDYNRNLPLVIDPILSYSTFLGGADLDAANSVAVDRNGNLYVAGETLSLNFPVFRPIRTNSAGNGDVFVTKLSPTAGLVYSTYLGGGGYDAVRSIAVDRNGSAYIAGDTDSANFPTRNPYQAGLSGDADAFVARISVAGTNLVYASYLGGQDYDSANGITADDSGSAFIAGETFSGQSFPRKNFIQANPGGFLDAFVARFDTALSGNASLNFSSWWGGVDDERALAIALDSDTNVVVVGEVLSLDLVNASFPTRPQQTYQPNYAGGGSDGFVLKVNAFAPNAPSVVFSTYLGGEAEDTANDVAVDSNDHIVIVGRTTSPDFPIADAAQAEIRSPFGATPDAFVTRLQRTGASVLYSTYLGGEVIDEEKNVAVDNDGFVYVGGSTTSLDFPVTSGADQALYGGGSSDGFVTKIRPEVIGSNALVYSTFIGGNDLDIVTGVDIDPAGNFYVGGQTASSNFLATAGTTQTRHGGGYSDAFAAKYLALSDLGVTVATSVDPIPLGSNFTYTVRVYNNGRTTFTGVGLSNSISPWVRFISATSTRGSCSHSGGVVSCTFGQLTNNAQVTVTITGRADVAGTATNVARVYAAEVEQNSGNNVAVVENVIKGTTDLVVTQTSTPNPVPVTSNVVHTISVRNAGTVSPATLVNVTHFFPPSGGSFSFGSSQGGCVFDGAALFCDLGTINPGATAIIMITNRPANAGTFTNVVQATLHEIDLTPGNNTSASVFTVAAFPDVAVRLSAVPVNVSVTSNITYTVAVTNQGFTPAPNVTIRDVLPAELSFVRYSTNTANCSVNGQTVTCNVGNLAAGAGTRFTLTIRATFDGSVVNTVTASSDLPDPVLTNNSASVTVNVTPASDLMISQYAWPEPLTEDNRTAFNVAVINGGPSTVNGVWFTNRLPTGVTFLSFTAVNAVCNTNPAATVISCNAGTLTNQERASVQIRVRAPTSGLHTNVVITRGTTPVDLNQANNTNSIVLEVLNGATLGILSRTNEVVLGWPTNRGTMRLFSSPQLAVPQWTRVTNAPFSFLDYNVLTQQISGANLFYRLER